MKNKIKSITKTAQEYHPAVGFHYIVEFENGTKLQMSDDELMSRFKSYRNGSEIQTLVGKPMYPNDF